MIKKTSLARGVFILFPVCALLLNLPCIRVCSTVLAQEIPREQVTDENRVIDRIVAVVNNEIITLVQLNKAVSPFKENIVHSQYSEEKKDDMIRKLENDMLHQLIDRSLARQEAKKYQIKVDDTEVDAAINKFKARNNLDQEGFKKALEAEGLLFQDYRQRIREDMLQSRLINRAVRSKVIITDSDIKKYYEENKEQYKGSRKYHLRNILMESEDRIKSVKDQLDSRGSFIRLAKQYSIAPNASDGGDLGLFDIENISENIKAAVKPLKEKEYSDIIETGQGYQIFYIEDIVMDGGKTLEQAQDSIRDILYKDQINKKFAKWVESLKDNAHIKIML